MYYHSAQVNPLFRQQNSKNAVLCLHGFTGTPDCLRHLVNSLADQGFTVSAPLLAGHGTTKEHLAKTNWKNWYKSSKEAFNELSKNYPHVSVAGLSLGGLLSLKLAIDYPDTVKNLALLATPIYLFKWVRATLPAVMNTPIRLAYKYQKKGSPDVKDPIAKQNYWNIEHMPLKCIQSITDLQKVVRKDINKIHCPTLIMHSRYDSTAPFDSMNYIAKNISSSITETIALKNSYHLITIDYEKELVSDKVSQFFKNHAN